MLRANHYRRERSPLRGNHGLNGHGHGDHRGKGVQHRDGMAVARLGDFLAMPGAIAAAPCLQRGAGETQAGHQYQNQTEMGNCTQHDVTGDPAIRRPTYGAIIFNSAKDGCGGYRAILGYPEEGCCGAKFQIALLAVALLFANAWCVAQCAVTPTPCHVPPCHRHQQSVKPCASPVVVEAANAVPHSPLAVIGALPSWESSPDAPWRIAAPPAETVSPPPPLISTPIRA